MNIWNVSHLTTQADQVHHRIRMDILAGRMPPGARILMNEIAGRHEVSLGAVREALSRLAVEHMVIAVPQRGYSVATLSMEELTDLTHTRISIEQICIRSAIEFGGVDWEAALIASLHRLQRFSEVEDSDRSRLSDNWSKAHGKFHQALVSGCPSVWMHKIRSSLYLQTERYRQLSVPLRTVERDVAGEHLALCDAALNRRREEACELIRDHLLKTTEILMGSPLLSSAPRDGSAAEPIMLLED